MRKTYATMLAVSTALLSFGQFGQLQNGGFENWSDNHLYDAPSIWESQPTDNWKGIAAVTQSNDASHGNYSVEITSVEHGSEPDTTFGFVVHGVVGDMGPESGIAYTDQFDEITFDYKSDLPVGDTLYMLAIRFDAIGDVIEQFFVPAAYGTNSSWSNGSIMVTSGAQTELLIGFVIGNPFIEGPLPTPDAWARVDNLVLKNSSVAATDIPNYSFENWDAVSTEEPNDWYTFNDQMIGAGVLNVTKTTDANSGTYAAEISTVYNAVWDEVIPGYLNIGEIDFENGGSPFTGIPYDASPTHFEYSYKYSGANGDLTGGILIEMYNGGANIGGGMVNATDQANYFTGSLELVYTGTPDSIIVTSFSGDSLGSVLKVDDFAFSGGDVGIDEFKEMSLDLYPNPTSEFVMVKADGVYAIQIMDVMGKIVFKSNQNNGVTNIPTNQLNKGAYFVTISSGGSQKTQKLIIK